MKGTNPLIIQLYNMDESVIRRFEKENLEHSEHPLNGMIDVENIDEIPYFSSIPNNIHEADFIIIDTTARKQKPANRSSNINIQVPDGVTHYNILPFDVHSIMNGVKQTSHNQCVIFFMSRYFAAQYTVFLEGYAKPSHPNYNTTGIEYNDVSRAPKSRQGSFFSPPGDNKYRNITKLLNKHIKDAIYNVVFPQSLDSTLLMSKSGEVVSKVSEWNTKVLFFFPDIRDKAGFLAELFTSVFPSEKYDFISKNLSDYGDFRWINDFPYLSHNERKININIATEKARHEKALNTLEHSLTYESQRIENVKLKNYLLKPVMILRTPLSGS